MSDFFQNNQVNTLSNKIKEIAVTSRHVTSPMKFLHRCDSLLTHILNKIKPGEKHAKPQTEETQKISAFRKLHRDKL